MTQFPEIMEHVADTLLEKKAGARWISGAKALTGKLTGPRATVQRLAQGRAADRMPADLRAITQDRLRGVKKRQFRRSEDSTRRTMHQMNAQSFRVQQTGAKSSMGPSNQLHSMKRNDPDKHRELLRRVANRKAQ